MNDTTALINGVTIGAGTAYRWADWPSGLYSTPPIRTTDTGLPDSHGVTAGLDRLNGRLVAFDVFVRAASRADGEVALAVLEAAFAPSDSETTLDVRITGTPDEYRLYGRPRGVLAPLGRRFINGTARVRCEFMATDPRRYALTESTATTGLATSSGGLAFPALAPFVFGTGGTGNTMSCFNAGTIATPWVATFTGPLVAPELVHNDTGKRLSLTGASLVAGDVLVVDAHDGVHTVIFNGAARYAWLAATSQWFLLEPGANSVVLLGASGAGSVSIAWRSAWA